MQGLLGNWGYAVIAAASESVALTRLLEIGRRPDLIICDYRLAEGPVGVAAIERLRQAFEIPAFIVTGERTLEPLSEADSAGIDVLQKPLDPKSLWAMVTQMLRPAHGTPEQVAAS
jgi:CheY-like chemotaxis protein